MSFQSHNHNTRHMNNCNEKSNEPKTKRIIKNQQKMNQKQPITKMRTRNDIFISHLQNCMNKRKDNLKKLHFIHQRSVNKQNSNKYPQLKIQKPRCPRLSCQKQLNDVKCDNGNHIIVICQSCGWKQHNSLNCQDHKQAKNKQEYLDHLNIITINKNSKLQYFTLHNLPKTKVQNNIKQTIQRLGYQMIKNVKIVPGTPQHLICNYPILTDDTSKLIIKNRQNQCYLPLTIKQSTIQGAGLGVFSTQRITKVNTLICSYLGEIGTGSVIPIQKCYEKINPSSQLKTRSNKNHMKIQENNKKIQLKRNDSVFTLGWLQKQKQIMVMVPNFYCNVGRFVNYNSQQNCNLKPNLCLVQISSEKYEICVFLSNTKTIEAGQQLFYNYGAQYQYQYAKR